MEQESVDDAQPQPRQEPLPAPQQARKSGQPWWVWALVIAGLSAPACGVVSALGIYGVRKYITNAKQAEGRHAVGQIAIGIASCANATGRLPETSGAVPADLGRVSGMKYQSARSEWSADPAFSCARFSISSPQYFQYRWVHQGPTQGYAEAVCDLDGDGVPDNTFRVRVECAGDGQCQAAPNVEESPPG